MRDFTDRYPDRKFDVMFWVNADAMRVDPVQAFLCPPNDEDTRWVPEKGYSVCVGGNSLCRTEVEAAARLRAELLAETESAKKRVAAIEEWLRS